jgi:anti-sigma factor RsiW
MMGLNCDAVRDALPLLVRDPNMSPEAAAVAAHLERCGECRAERELVHFVHGLAEAVPAGLETRVVEAVRRRTTRRFAPSRLAVAATVAAALLGGSLVLDRWGYEMAPPPNGAALVFEDNVAVVSWNVSDDPLLQSGTTLQQLSVEELEFILAELDS